MPDLFGAVAGERLAEQDSQARQLFQLSMAEGQTKLEHEKVVLETSKMALQGQQKMLAQISSKQLPTKTAQTLPDMLDMYAEMSANSGMPQQAADFASKASTIRKQSADIDKEIAGTKMKRLTEAAALLDGVKTEQELNQAKAFYRMQNPGDKSLENLQFKDIEKLKAMVTTEKEKAQIAATKARTAAAQAEVKEREARVPLVRAQTRVAEQRDANLKKNGSVSAIPKAGDLQAITDQMVLDYGDPLSPGDYRVLARPVAEHMLDLMRKQGLSKSEAARTAYAEAVHEGAFGGLRERRKELGSFERPLEIPVDKQGKPDKSKMRANMFYPVKGQIMLWTGEEFVLPRSERPAEDEDDTEAEENQ